MGLLGEHQEKAKRMEVPSMLQMETRLPYDAAQVILIRAPEFSGLGVGRILEVNRV